MEELRVQVPAARPPSGEELIENLYTHLRAQSPRRERTPGEAIEPGDEVECDIVTLVAGRLVPGGTKAGVRWEMREFVSLPGLLEQVVGMPTGSAKTFALELPDDYPVPSVAGQTATVYFEARRAFQVDPVDMENPATLSAAGLGESFEEALEIVAERLDLEQGEALLVEATQVVLSALAGRVSEEIPPAAIDEELRQVWQKSEGILLGQKGFPVEMAAQAQADFLNDPLQRAQAETRIKLGLALSALIEKEGLRPTEDTMSMLLDNAAAEVGVSSEEARRSLVAEPLFALQAGQTALYLNAVEFVMSRAVVQVIEPLNATDDE